MKNDVAYVAILIIFFAVAALFVVACDKIIGSDEEALAAGADEVEPAPAEKVAA